MRTRFLLLACLSLLALGCARATPAPAARAFDQTYPEWMAVLARYVDDTGVDYAGLAQNQALLESAAGSLSGVARKDFARWTKDERLAFLINAHNLFALRRIVAAWPVESIEATCKLGSARDARDIPLLGRKWSLNQLADVILGDEFQEARALFLLSWGQRGCPPLAPVPVTALNLPDLLERQPKRFLASAAYCTYDVPGHMISVSPLIGQQSPALVRDFTTLWVFLERYLPAEQARQMKSRAPKIRYLDFDTTLNQSTRTAAQPPAAK